MSRSVSCAHNQNPKLTYGSNLEHCSRRRMGLTHHVDERWTTINIKATWTNVCVCSGRMRVGERSCNKRIAIVEVVEVVARGSTNLITWSNTCHSTGDTMRLT